jgi:fimbrial isopeptide formation D2 family protein
LIDSSYAWGTPTVSNPVTVVRNEVVGGNVINPVTRVKGKLVITKQLVDPSGEVDGGRTYAIDYACLYTGVGAVAGTVELAAGESATIDGILLESRCSVEEDPETLDNPPVPGEPSWVWLPPSYNPGTSVLVESATQPATVTVTNTTNQLTGTFQLTKSVVGSGKTLGYTPGTQFTFDVECDDGFAETVLLADAESWTPATAIPIDTVCTIAETDKPAPNSSAYGWDEVVFSVDRARSNGPSVTFTVGQTAIQINATNPITPRVGSLQLTKEVTGERSGLDAGARFQVSVNCGPGNLFVATLTDGIPEIVENIPAGSTCTVFEQPPVQDQLADASYAWEPAVYHPGATVTIGVDQQVDVRIENPIVRVTAPVRVVKTLTGGEGVIDPTRTYPITWSCTYNGGSVAGGTIDAVVDPSGVQVADAVPLTSACSATEGPLGSPSADPAYRWLEPAITGTTVTQPGPNTITVANTLTRDSGRVLVHKQVTGATAGYTGTGAVFTMHGQCLVPGSPEIPTRFADGAIADGGTVEIAPVSARWTCSGFEDTPGQNLLRDPSYSWGQPIITGNPALTPPVGGTFSLASADAVQDFYVENPIVRVSNTFQITKNVVDPFGALLPGTTFTGTYSCRSGDDDPVTGTWTLANGSTFTGPSVYLGSVCTVTENPLGTSGLLDGSFAWTDPTISGPVTVVPGGTATVTVTNTIKRLYAGLQITKSLVDPDGGVREDTQFTGVWTCSLGDQTFRDRWTAGADASTTVFTPGDARVPATAVCSITEDTPDPANLIDESYAWADRAYAPENVTLVADQTAGLSVTNTVVRVYSGIFIAKDITGPADGLVPTNRPFTGTVSCRYRDADPVVATWSATTAAAWSSGNYLVGSMCTVASEDSPGLTGQPVPGDPSYIWSDPIIGDPVVVPAPTPEPAENRPTITVANPTDRLFGRFFMTKAVSGATGGITDPQPFPMSYSCQPGVGEAIAGDIELAAGQTITVGPDPEDDIELQIPVNSVCTLTEPLDTMPPLVDSAVSWGEPQFAVLGPIPTAGPVTEECVTPPDGEPQMTPCLGFAARSVTVTIPPRQEDYPDPPSVGLQITNPVLQSFGAYTVAKSSDPASGSVVAPGETVTYSVTVNSTGDVPVHDVVVTDDLSTVLPYAAIGTITAPDGTTASVNADAAQLVWTVGTVPNGESPTLTYQATVNSGATGVTIRNLVTSTGDVPPSTCTEPDDPKCTTTHTTPNGPTISKEPAGDPVPQPGTGNWIVPYRITVTNPNADVAVPYTLTDNIAYPTDVAIVSGTVTTAPDGVTLFDPAWNGSDRTTIAADVSLPGGVTHTFGIAVVASVPLTLASSQLVCAASGSGGGSGFFNVASVSSMGSSASDDACDPIPVILVADKRWVINGVAYTDGTQPAGYSATLTLDGVAKLWRTGYWALQPGISVAVGENAVVPASCTSSSSGTGPVTLTVPLTSVIVTNVVTCTGPAPPGPAPPAPGPSPPGPTPPLPNTGFALEPFLAWGLGLLLAGALLVLGAGWRSGRRRTAG